MINAADWSFTAAEVVDAKSFSSELIRSSFEPELSEVMLNYLPPKFSEPILLRLSLTLCQTVSFLSGVLPYRVPDCDSEVAIPPIGRLLSVEGFFIDPKVAEFWVPPDPPSTVALSCLKVADEVALFSA